VAHAGGVDDARHAAEARLVEVRRGHVERQLVEQLGQQLLVELDVDVALAQRHLGDRAHARARRDADAAQRRDDAAARGLREVEARGLRREEVGDVRAMSAPVAVMPMKIGPVHSRIAAAVFSPSAVCASSQMTTV
jgi:hypothetical protein